MVSKTIGWLGKSGGSFFTASNWDGGVPNGGDDALIVGVAGAPLTVNLASSAATVVELGTKFAGLNMTSGSLTITGGDSGFASGGFTTAITTTGVAFTQSGGLLDLQNGISQNETSEIAGNAAAVIQTGGTIRIDAGTLELAGNSSFAGLLTSLGGIYGSPGSTLEFRNGNSYTFTKSLNGKTSGQISVTNWEVLDQGSKIILAEKSLVYAGNLTEAVGTAVQLAGNTLTLSGAVDSGASYAGSGLVNIAFTASMALDNAGLRSGATVGSGATIDLSGTITDSSGNSLTLGDSGRVEADLLIDRTGIFDITGDIGAGNGYTGIARGGNSAVVLVGLMEKTDGISNAFVDATVTGTLDSKHLRHAATGTVEVGAGAIYFRGTNNDFAGVLTNLGTGSGGVVFGGGGTYTLESTASVTTDFFSILDTGTSLNLKLNLTYGGTMAQAGGTGLQLNGHTLTITDIDTSSASFTVGATVATPNSRVLVTGRMTDSAGGVNNGGMSVAGGVLLEVAGSMGEGPDDAGDATVLNLGDRSSLAATLQIDDKATSSASTKGLVKTAGTFDFTGDSGLTGIFNTGSNGTALIQLKGMLEKTAGVGSNYVDPTVVMSAAAVVGVAAGNIYFRGTNNMFAGKFKNIANGQGGVIFGGGGLDTILGGAAFTTSFVTVQDANTKLSLREGITYNNGTLVEAASTTILLNGHTLVLGGSAKSGTVCTITSSGSYGGGSGVVLINPTATFTDSDGGVNNGGISVAGGVTIDVKGSFNAGPNGGASTVLNLGNTPLTAAILLIDTVGTFDFTGDLGFTGIAHTGNGIVRLNGLMEKSGGTGVDFVAANVTMSAIGTVAIQSGSIDFQGASDSFAGTFEDMLGGNGATIVFGGSGSHTLSNAIILTDALAVQDNGTVLRLATNESFSGVFSQGTATDVQLAGRTLTLSGTTSLAGTIAGPGRLLVQNLLQGKSIEQFGYATTDGMTVGGGTTLEIASAAAQSLRSTIGDGSPNTAEVLIDKGADFSLTGNALIGADGASVIVNNGTLEKTAGTGTGEIDAAISNIGTINALSGTLTLAANITNSSLIAAVGTTINFGGQLTGNGQVTLQAGASAEFGGVVGVGQTLKFLDSTNFAIIDNVRVFNGTISGFVVGDTIDLKQFNVTAHSLSGRTLQVVSNDQTADLTFSGALHGTFAFTSDLSNGTYITLTSGGGGHAAITNTDQPGFPLAHLSG